MALTPTYPGGQDVPSSVLLPFLLAAFGIAWGTFALFGLAPEAVVAIFGPVSAHQPLFILAVYAPAITAVALVLWHGGGAGLGRFLSRLLLWRTSAGWVAFILLGIPAIYVAGAAYGGTLAGWRAPGPLLGAMGLMLILGPVEELGWRGLALPLLQRRLAPAWAGMVLGLIWGVWHLPAFFLTGTLQSAWAFAPFLIGATGASVIMTSLFNRSRGSLLLAALVHFQLNNPLWPDAQPYDMALFAAVALLVLWLDRAAMFTRAGATTEVMPAPVALPAALAPAV